MSIHLQYFLDTGRTLLVFLVPYQQPLTDLSEEDQGRLGYNPTLANYS